MAVSDDYTDDLDLSDDYTAWDATEAVTLLCRDKINGNAEWAVDTALRLPITTKEAAASGGVYTTQDVVWLLPNKLLLGGTGEGEPPIPRRRTPLLGDKITGADGVRWTLLDASYSPLDGTYRCTSRALAIVHQLADIVSVLRPITRQDAASGRLVVDRVPVAIDMAARIQEVGGEVAEARGKRGTRRRYIVYLEEPVVLKEGDVVQDIATGLLYEYVSHQDVDRIDQLMQVTAERTP